MVLIWRMNDSDWIIIMIMITWFKMDSNVILMDLNQRVIKGIIMVYVMGY